jgi:ubiquinone/menaquinone biosynthesis C-methylase UbiE
MKSGDAHIPCKRQVDPGTDRQPDDPETPSRHHPDSVLEAVRLLTFVCPQCKRSIGATQTEYVCHHCDRRFPVISGIPDLRIVGDPFLGFDEDYARTEIVLERLEELHLRELLEHYWTYSDITPERLRRAFVVSAMRGEARAARALAAWQAMDEADFRSLRCLEIGSGTGNLLVAASRRGIPMVGTDVAMRWLHLSRRRFLDANLPIPALVCCNAEHLPFADASFEAAFALSTLEFVRDVRESLADVSRSLVSSGVVYGCSVNRYSIATNPYADLWGVGWLPRSLQARYVHFRRGASFDKVHLLSRNEIRNASHGHFDHIHFELSDAPDATLLDLTLASRIQIRTYRMLKRVPGLRSILIRIGPEWDMQFRKHGRRHA